MIQIPDLQFCAVWAGDVTGNGAPDLYFSNYVKPPDTALDVLLINDGNGNFTDESAARLGNLRNSAFGTSVEIRDMDDDGDNDIVKSSALFNVAPWNSIGVFILFNEGNGQFVEYQSVPTEASYMFTVDDLTNDGLPDLYIVNDAQDFVDIALSADPEASPPIPYQKDILSGSPRTYFLGGNVKCADLDNDGDLDVGVADVDIDLGTCDNDPGDLRKLAFLRNAGIASGDLEDPWGTSDGPWNVNAFDFSFVDINRDGRLDLFVCGCEGYRVFLQEDRFNVDTSALDFGEVEVGARQTMSIEVWNSGATPRTVTIAASPDLNFSAEFSNISLAPFEGREVEVHFDPSSPVSYAASLSLDSGLESAQVSLSGVGVTPPVIQIDRTSISASVTAGERRTETIRISNTGGSDLNVSIVTGAVEEPVIIVAEIASTPLFVDACNQSGIPFALHGDIDVSAADLAGSGVIALGLSAGSISGTSTNVIADAVEGGQTLILSGAPTSTEFFQILDQRLLESGGGHPWRQPAQPHFNIGDTGHPLSDGLPSLWNFAAPSASWYRYSVDDPGVWVAARNGDGVPCLGSKKVGSGRVIFFANWPLDPLWSDPNDRQHFYTMFRNAVHFSDLSWLSVYARDLVIPSGQFVDVSVILNTYDQPAGNVATQIILQSNDALAEDVTVPISLQVVPPPFELRLTEVDDTGGVHLLLTGDIGSSCAIQRCSELENWMTIQTIFLSEFENDIIDPAPDEEGPRMFYYRTVELAD